MAKPRKSIRALMLTPEEKILLMQLREPSSGFTFWILPGGGIEPGESSEQCLCREIAEETGLENFDIGPLIWRRSHEYEWGGKQYHQQEDIYLVCVDEFFAAMHNNPSAEESEIFQQFKWWSHKELSLSTEEFAPRFIADHLEKLLGYGPPKNPVDVGV